MPLDEDTVRLAQGKNLATVVTLMPDGQAQALLTWVDSDGEYLLVNTEPQRQRARNLRRDPRITVLIHSGSDPWDWSAVRGRVVDSWTGRRRASTSTSCPASTSAATTATRSARRAG
jgi:PPOX class probable F420-dependent enzyme